MSTSKQDIGAAAQRAELERWAAQRSVDLIAIFEDIGVSGAAPLAGRPGLVAAIAAMGDFTAGKLVAVKRDRFARHRHTIADIEREVVRAGGVLVTTDGTTTGDDSESEEVQATIQDLVASLELRKIRARNRARAKRCIADGRTHGGDVPYGQRRRALGITGRSGVVVELEPDRAAVALERRPCDAQQQVQHVGVHLVGATQEDTARLVHELQRVSGAHQQPQPVIELVAIRRGPRVEDHQVRDESFMSPVLMGQQRLSHERRMFELLDPHEQDGMVSRYAE